MGAKLKYTKKHFFIFILCVGLCLWSGNLLMQPVGEVEASSELSIVDTDPGKLLSSGTMPVSDAGQGSAAPPQHVAFILLGTGLVGLTCFSRRST